MGCASWQYGVLPILTRSYNASRGNVLGPMAPGATSQYYIVGVRDLIAELVQGPAIDAEAGPGDDVDRRVVVQVGAVRGVVPLLIVPDRPSPRPCCTHLWVVAIDELLCRFRFPSHYQRGGREPSRTCS